MSGWKKEEMRGFSKEMKATLKSKEHPILHFRGEARKMNREKSDGSGRVGKLERIRVGNIKHVPE